MVSIMEIMQLCRLCLVKEQVNIPIFEQPGDIREVFLKISACLPVKVSKEDKLPKKICDGCSYKLDLLYQFSNTCANAEKQLLTWLNQLNSDTMKEDADIAHQTQTSQPHPVKQEMLDIADNGNDTANSEYLLQQQFEGSDLAAVESHDENGGGDDGGGDDSSDDEPLAKRRKRLIKSHTDTGPLSGLHSVAHMAVTKTEDASDSDGDDNADDPEPSFVSVGTDDGQQPGPSGLGKASTDIPYSYLAPLVTIEESQQVKPNKRKSKKPIKVPDSKKTSVEDGDDSEVEAINADGVKIELEYFKCKICSDGKFMHRLEFKEHYKRDHKGKRLPRYASTPTVLLNCEICAKKFKSIRNLNEHMETHNNQFDCQLCQMTFKKPLEYTLHSKIHSDDDMFSCIYCDFKTGNINDITFHLTCSHENKHRYTCKVCNKGFEVLTWFKEHENYHTGQKPFSCEFCGKTFLYSRYLSAHKTSMHKEEITGIARKHECVVCNKQYQHRNSLRLHMNSHTGHVAICDICGKQLSSKEKLKFHLRIHTGYKPFKCAYCEKSFTKKPILVEHERIHTGERPYDCEYCHKAFSQRSSLVIHMRSHTGEKPYVCHVCNKGFVARAMLNIHFKTCKGY